MSDIPAMWQPIETAPKDGNVLVTGRWPDDGRFAAGTWWTNIGSCCGIGVYGDWDAELEPTHWMPLPLPPENTDEPG